MRAVWIGWGAALALLLIGLGLQVRYAEQVGRCLSTDRLQLCAGPLAEWLMPATVAIGLLLVAVGSWRIAVGGQGSPAIPRR
jgi:hypothetical protein